VTRLLLMAVLLAGCAAAPAPNPAENVAVIWNQVDNPQKVCDDLSGRKELFRILGCSKWSGPEKDGAPRTCTIYAPAPRNERDTQRFATLGHELMHCFDGNWHDRYGEMKPEYRQAAGASAAGRSSSGSAAAAE